ncbi:protein YAE1 homolog [Anopheles ziemanni]|uniref:protein YAE1 homolog n=1 Tax=Anopheles ziemanni TaxID=345580 RepID=UPI00265EB350|nr:protein YAE1 homolog [Anopheles ziemanni]
MDREDIDMAERDAQRATEPLVKAAYADGVDAGRQLHYQRNFDEGYRKGFAVGFEHGQQQARRALEDVARRKEAGN